MSNTYHLYCNSCGGKFQADRSHARTCSDLCRLALSNVYKKIKEDESGLTEEEIKHYKELKAKIEGKGKITGIITGKNSKPEETDEQDPEPEETKDDDEKE